MSERETANWKTYSDEKVLFRYPTTWDQKPTQLVGSGYTDEINDSQGVFVFTVTQRGNYNNGTGKPFASLDEYINTSTKAPQLLLDTPYQSAIQPLPRAGSENIFEVDFFSKDTTVIYSLNLQPKNNTSDHT